MKICILGGSGYLGWDLVGYLVDLGEDVLVLDKAPPDNFIYRPNLEFRQCDMQDPKSYKNHIARCDCLCLYASTSMPGMHDKCPISEIENDVVHYGRLLEVIKNFDISRIVYLSSGGAVYGASNTVPLVENDRTRPTSSYGCGKLCIELLIERYEELSNWSYTILRPSNPVGLGQNKKISSHGLVTTVLYKIKRGDSLQIWGDGLVVRDYFDVSDLTRAVVVTMTKQQAINQVFNVGSGVGRSTVDIISICESITGKSVKIERLPDRSFDVPFNVLNITKIGELCGWKPEIKLEQTIQNIWNVIK